MKRDEMTQTERLAALCERISGMVMECPEARAIMAEEDWADHWPVVTHDGRGRLVYSGEVVESGEVSEYASVDNDAMCDRYECLIDGDGEYRRQRRCRIECRQSGGEWGDDQLGSEVKFPLAECRRHIEDMQADPEWSGWEFRIMYRRDNRWVQAD